MHLKVKSNWNLKPVYDVIAKIPGSTRPDEWVIRGNHHDAWVNGAEDPISGMVAVLEEARALGELAESRAGSPSAPLFIAAWDGEEPGLLGSTEWAEEHADELTTARRRLHQLRLERPRLLCIEGSHTLEKFINDVARDITDPETKLSRLEAQSPARNRQRQIRRGPQEARQRADLRIARSGLRLRLHRVPAARRRRLRSIIGFGGEDGGGIYHSIYDDFYWYTHFSDTDFVYGRALAQTGGTMVMRLADAESAAVRIRPTSATPFRPTSRS